MKASARLHPDVLATVRALALARIRLQLAAGGGGKSETGQPGGLTRRKGPSRATDSTRRPAA